MAIVGLWGTSYGSSSLASAQRCSYVSIWLFRQTSVNSIDDSLSLSLVASSAHAPASAGFHYSSRLRTVQSHRSASRIVDLPAFLRRTYSSVLTGQSNTDIFRTRTGNNMYN